MKPLQIAGQVAVIAALAIVVALTLAALSGRANKFILNFTNR